MNAFSNLFNSHSKKDGDFFFGNEKNFGVLSQKTWKFIKKRSFIVLPTERIRLAFL